MRAFVSVLVICVLSAGGLGCGNSTPQADHEETVPASGTVTYRGKPLADCVITFVPADGRRPASGKSDADGQFSLGTNAEGDGAAPGTHKVGVVYEPAPFEGEPGKEEFVAVPKAAVRLPAKYADPETSGITVEVPSSGSGELRIELR